MSEANESLESMFESMLSRFKGMSWAEITYLVEDEEEAALALEKSQKMQAVAAKRKELLAKGEYELEDGEILE